MSETKAVTVTEQKGLAINNFEDLLRISEFLAKSELIPSALRKKPADVAIILMKGNELGLQPMQALDSIDVIQGKPALKPEAQLALIYQKVADAQVVIEADDAKQIVIVAMTRPGKASFKTTWTMERARKMGLASKDNYVKQPTVMLKWRAVGEAARTVFPDITRGMYNTTEAEDFGSESGPSDDKAKRLSSLINEDKPPTKDVTAETTVTTVAEEVPQEVAKEEVPASSYDPDFDREERPGDHTVAVKAPFKGSKLKEVPLAQLSDYVLKAKKFYAETKAPPTEEWRVFLAKAEEYLNSPAA